MLPHCQDASDFNHGPPKCRGHLETRLSYPRAWAFIWDRFTTKECLPVSRDDFGCPSRCVECAALVFSVAEDRDAAEDIYKT